MSAGSSIRCSRRNRKAWGWACRFVARLSRPTRDDCGLPGIRREARYSNLSCPLLQPETEYLRASTLLPHVAALDEHHDQPAVPAWIAQAISSRFGECLTRATAQHSRASVECDCG